MSPIIVPSIPSIPSAQPPEIPHFAYPFAFQNVNGQVQAAVVEQDSIEEILACVNAIVACPIGTRDELPGFGVPDVLFAQAPLNPSTVVQAIVRWEPRARIAASEFADAGSDAQRHLQLEISAP